MALLVDLLDPALLTAIGGSASAFGAWFVRSIALPTLKGLNNMEKYHAKVDAIYKELTPNGGSSLKDQVTFAAKAINILAAKDRIQLELDKRPTFEADENGEYRWVNKAFCRTFGYNRDEMTAQGWKNLVHSDDVDAVVNKWARAVADKREYHQSFQMVTQGGQVLNVSVEASPLLDGKQDLLGYFGYLTVN